MCGRRCEVFDRNDCRVLNVRTLLPRCEQVQLPRTPQSGMIERKFALIAFRFKKNVTLSLLGRLQ